MDLDNKNIEWLRENWGDIKKILNLKTSINQVCNLEDTMKSILKNEAFLFNVSNNLGTVRNVSRALPQMMRVATLEEFISELVENSDYIEQVAYTLPQIKDIAQHLESLDKVAEVTPKISSLDIEAIKKVSGLDLNLVSKLDNKNIENLATNLSVISKVAQIDLSKIIDLSDKITDFSSQIYEFSNLVIQAKELKRNSDIVLEKIVTFASKCENIQIEMDNKWTA